MKKIFFLLLAIPAFSYLHAQTNSSGTDINKILEFKNDMYDFGKIPFGKAASYDITVKNISQDSASIDNVQVGCGCTTPKYEKGKKFGPGQSIVVTLGFNGYTNGKFTKQATLFFNNGTLSKVVNFTGETFQAQTNPAPANGAVEKLKASTN